jgi:hypothetical protein
MTSADAIYSFTRILDPKVNSKRREILADVKGAEAFSSGKSPKVEGLEAPDPGTLRITRERPLAYFLQLLATPSAAIIPPGSLRRSQKGYLSHPWVAALSSSPRWDALNSWSWRPRRLLIEDAQARPDPGAVHREPPPARWRNTVTAGSSTWTRLVGSETAIAREMPDDYRKAPRSPPSTSASTLRGLPSRET